MPAAEHVQRQIAVAVVIAVEEAAFLVAVHLLAAKLRRSNIDASAGTKDEVAASSARSAPVGRG